MGTHASKQSLGPLEPTLQQAGLGPVTFGALTVVPGIASVVLPTVWGAAWAHHAPVVLLLSPLAQLVAQTMLAVGLSLRASASADGWAAAVAIILGLMLFSLGRAGIAVAQHAMLARTFTANLAFAFSVVVGCTQLIASACAWAVPRILAAAGDAGGDEGGATGSGLLHVQIVLLLPHAASSVAGAVLALQHTSTALTLSRGEGSNVSLPSLYGSPSIERPPWRHAIWLLALWRALTVGSFHAFHPVIVALLVSLGLPLIAAGDVLAANSFLSLGAFLLVGLLGRTGRLKVLLIAAPLVALAASLSLWLGTRSADEAGEADVGVALRTALLLMAFVGAAAPIVPLAMVPANVEHAELGRGYGIVESVFEASEVSLSVLLGVCRSVGGFSLALLLLTGSFGLAVLVGLPLTRGARERPLAEDGLLELSVRKAGQAARASLERGRAALKLSRTDEAGSPQPSTGSEELSGQNGDYFKLETPEKAGGGGEGQGQGGSSSSRAACLLVYVLLAVAVIIALVLAPLLGVHALVMRQNNGHGHGIGSGSGIGSGVVQVIGSDGPRDVDGVSHSYWSLKPSDPPSYDVAVGTALLFRYSQFHNLWEMPSKVAFDACDFSDARELASTTHGGVAAADVDRLGYANVYEAAMDTAGTAYFACQVSDHCQKGQKIAVTVSDD